MASKVDKYIGEKIREKRRAAKLDQQTVADITHLSRASISNIEAGRTSTTNKNIYTFCCLFNCSVSDLFPPIQYGKVVRSKKKKRVIKEYEEVRLDGINMEKL